MINTDYKPSFGMATYMPKKSKLIEIGGERLANEIEAVTPQLNDWAKDRDIFVSIQKEKDRYANFLVFKVKVLETTVKNPIRRFLAKHNLTKLVVAERKTPAYTIHPKTKQVTPMGWFDYDLKKATKDASKMVDYKLKKY